MSPPQSSGISPPIVDPIKIPIQIADRMDAGYHGQEQDARAFAREHSISLEWLINGTGDRPKGLKGQQSETAADLAEFTALIRSVSDLALLCGVSSRQRNEGRRVAARSSRKAADRRRKEIELRKYRTA